MFPVGLPSFNWCVWLYNMRHLNSPGSMTIQMIFSCRLYGEIRDRMTVWDMLLPYFLNSRMFTSLHVVTSQNTWSFSSTAMRTSDLALVQNIWHNQREFRRGKHNSMSCLGKCCKFPLEEMRCGTEQVNTAVSYASLILEVSSLNLGNETECPDRGFP
jgi:hypothetical protein